MVLLPKAIFLTKHIKGPPNMVDSSSMPPKSLYPENQEEKQVNPKNQKLKTQNAVSALTGDRTAARRRPVEKMHVIVEIIHRDIASQ